MKKLMISLFFCSVAMGIVKAQNETMYLMKGGYEIAKYTVADVDSVVFYNPNSEPTVSFFENPAQNNGMLIEYDAVEKINHIVNNSSTYTEYTWELLSNTASNPSTIRVLLCDPFTCLPPNSPTGNFTLAKGASGLFDVSVKNVDTSITESNRIIEKFIIKYLIYPKGHKELAVLYTAILNCF